MGLFNTIRVPCPECGTKQDAQSKSGLVTMSTYELDDAPEDVLADVNRHAPFVCENCGTGFDVKLTMIRTTRRLR